MLAKCVDVANPIVSVLDGIPYIRVIFFCLSCMALKLSEGDSGEINFVLEGKEKMTQKRRKSKRKKKLSIEVILAVLLALDGSLC